MYKEHLLLECAPCTPAVLLPELLLQLGALKFPHQPAEVRADSDSPWMLLGLPSLGSTRIRKSSW